MRCWARVGFFLLLAAAAAAAEDRGRPAVVEWAPDGKILIASNGLLARFDLDSDEEALLDRRVSAFAVSPDGARLAVGGANRLELRRYPELAGLEAPPLPELAEVTALAWSPDGQTLAAGTAAGHVLLWDMADKELWADLNVAPASGVERLRFSADGRRLLSAFLDGRAVLWDLARREEVRRYPLPRPEAGASGAVEVQAIADLSADGRLVLATRTPEQGDAEMLLLDDAGEVKWRRAGYAMEFARDTAGAPDAGVLVLAPPFRIAALYRTSDAAALRVFEPPEAVTTLYLVRQSPDGKFLLGVGEDHQGQVLILWDFSTGEVLKTHR